MSEEKVAKLREALGSVVTFDTGDVVRFKTTYPDSASVYNFAAIYSGRRWFITGGRHTLGQGLSTPAFLRLLSGQHESVSNSTINDVELATAWTSV